DETPPGFRLSATGQVLDPSGKAVAGATVYLRQWPKLVDYSGIMKTGQEILATMTTDQHGRFSFQDVPAAAGYAALSGVGATQFPWDVFVQAQEGLAFKPLTPENQREPLALILEPETRLQGRLVGTAGKPISGAQVK